MLGKYREINLIKLKNEKNHVQNVGVQALKRTEKKMLNKAINAMHVIINFSIQQYK